MSVYTPNIPQPGDNPSDSQDQLLQNFQTLQNLYGTSGDHYSWTNTNPPESTKHAKVTTPGLPTSTAPGNAIPAPLSGNCSYFAQTRNSQTYPYLTRDGLVPAAPLTNIWPVLPIKVYAIISVSGTTPTLSDNFNVSSISLSSVTSTHTITINLSNTMRTTAYGVLITTSLNATQTRLGYAYTVVNTSQFTVTISNILGSTYSVTIIALES